MTSQSSKNQSVLRANIIPISFAFFVWGGWAYYINLASGQEQALISGLTQATYSALVTIYMSYSVNFLWNKCSKNNFGDSSKMLLPTVGTVGHTGLILVTAHWLNHTPNILKTVSAPLTVATLYSLYLTKQIHKQGSSK